MRLNLRACAVAQRQLRNAQPVRAFARRQISTSSEALKPASAVAQVARPAEQRYTPAPSYPRDTGSVPGVTRDSPGVGVSVNSGLPQVAHDERRISVGWMNGSRSRFHHIWLRDHCRCSECLHPVTKQRLVNTFEIPPDIQPAKVESNASGLEVTWQSSQHVSVYPWEWLSQSSYDPPLNWASASNSTNRKTLWGSSIKNSRPTVSYDEVMKDDVGVLKWLENIDEFGVCFVEGVPPTPEDTEALTKRIAFIRDTKYGGFWDFTSDLKHGDTAYTNLALQAHTDTTYLTDPCGLQLFHLLSHEGTGGHTLLVDGFYAASMMREQYPSHYNLLTQVKISAHAAGDADSLYIPGEPFSILKTDMNGKLIQVRYNNDDRSVLKHIDPVLVDDWYDALRSWNRCLTHADSEYWVKLSAGTVVIMDNHRVLHGRSAFTGKRRMCGAYIGTDEWMSRLRVLSRNMGKRAWDKEI
ncbi:Trimethyllysine dioxygenase [Ceratobasidium sp. AG-I]|nr:Trimethyllysine dioxygenase [Ceratobasidium sp. AG-I]